MSPVETLPDELLEKIVGLLAPPFSTTASLPQKKNMFSLDKTKKAARNSARPILDETLKTQWDQSAPPATQKASANAADLCSLTRVNKRFNYIATPVLYQNITMRVSEVTTMHDNFLKAVRGPAGAFVRAVSIRDPDPVAYPRTITPNYRNNMISAFSNFLVHFFNALSGHSSLVSFHWNVFDTLLIAPMFMDSLPQEIQEFTLDQGRVIPIGEYSNLRKFVYRAHMLSCTSNCVYERRVSRLLYYNFQNIRHLQLQNVNLAVCFEFRSAGVYPSRSGTTDNHGLASASPSSVESEQSLYWPTPVLINPSASTSSSGSPSTSSSTSPSLSGPTPLSGVPPSPSQAPNSTAHSSSFLQLNHLAHPSPISPYPQIHSPISSSESSAPVSSSAPSQPSSPIAHPKTTIIAPRPTTSASVYFLSPPTPPQRTPILFPNLETAYFTDLFTASSVSSFNCEWLIDLLNDHRTNKNLIVKYASRCVGKDAIFAREWGLLIPDPDAVGVNGYALTDEESFRRAGWASGRKSGEWKGWSWEYSTIKGWTMTTTFGRDN